MIIRKKLPFPDKLATTDCAIELYGEMTENGDYKTVSTYEGKCIFSEKTKIIFTADGQRITLLGKLIVKGDIGPSVSKIGTGLVKIKDTTYKIFSASRPKNPDGSVHHTTLELA